MDSVLGLRTNSGIKFISYNEIVWFKAEGRYTIVMLKNGKSILTAKLLKNFENSLPSDIFIRIHKSYIINLTYILNYSKKSNNLTLNINSDLAVSRRRKKGLQEKLNSSFIIV
jgi:two-component system, LytTR family, response regulator